MCQKLFKILIKYYIILCYLQMNVKFKIILIITHLLLLSITQYLVSLHRKILSMIKYSFDLIFF
jgi:hypothetical protein